MKETFRKKHPYLFSILVGLLCTFFTALGMAIPQIMGFEIYSIYLSAVVGLVVSAIIGILIMFKTKIKLSSYGFRTSEKSSTRIVWWYLPLIVMELIPLVMYGFSGKISAYQYLIIALFTIAVGVNEEIYFRGLILRILSEKGKKHAIIGSAIIFGILHLSNAFNGKNILYLILQMFFAFFVGFVLAEIVSITKSLWIVIIWHASHDFISMTTEGELDTKALIILAIQVILLMIYAFGIWKKSITE